MSTAELKLLHQDGQLLIVHKPAGWTIYAEDGVPKDHHLQAVCQDMFAQKLFPVHRLDRATCGIVVFATDGRWAREMQEQFSRRKITKLYLALLEGKIDKPQTIDIPLKEKGKGQQSASTILSPKKMGNINGLAVSLVELNPKTGRFHQLRKHCKLIGHTIIGDKMYGSKVVNQINSERKVDSRLMLSAVELKFLHPRTKKEIRIKDTPDLGFMDILREARIRL